MPFLPENALPPAPDQPQLVLAAMALPPWVFSGNNLFLSPCGLSRALFTSQSLGLYLGRGGDQAAGVTVHSVPLGTGDLESEQRCH